MIDRLMFLVALAALLSLSCGCEARRGGGGGDDDDDSAPSDDDDATADDDDATADDDDAVSPDADEDLPCDEAQLVDIWTGTVSSNDVVTVRVDTVAASSTFDPRIFILDPAGAVVATADDDFDCEFPPPEYRCPFLEIPVELPGDYRVVVAQGAGSDCTGSIGEYSLEVLVDGSELSGFLLGDDVPSPVDG